MNRTRLREQLIKHEGKRLHLYVDTVGKTTIGVGRNLTDRGITEDEAMVLLDNDITDAFHACERLMAGFGTFSEPRQHAFVDLVFNLGEAGFGKFHETLVAVEARNWDTVAEHLQSSKWAKQVGQRAETIIAMIRTG